MLLHLLVNLNHTFKISLKTIIMGTTSQFHNGVHLKILILVFLMHIIYCQRKVFYEDESDKINKLSNSECNLASHINKIRGTAIKLALRDSFHDMKIHAEQQ